VKAELQALRHIRAHPDDAIRLIAELFDTDAETAAQSYALILPAFSVDGTVEREGVETLLELERAEDKGGLPLTFEQLVDTALVGEAQRELGQR
jgi:hypothetical protein